MHRYALQAYQNQNPVRPSIDLEPLHPLLNRIVQQGMLHQRQPRLVLRSRASFSKRVCAELIDTLLVTLPTVSILMGSTEMEDYALSSREQSPDLWMFGSLVSDLSVLLSVPPD